MVGAKLQHGKRVPLCHHCLLYWWVGWINKGDKGVRVSSSTYVCSLARMVTRFEHNILNFFIEKIL